MESFGSFFDDEWENLTTMLAGGQDYGQFSGNGLFSGENDQGFNLDTPSIVSPNNINSSFTDDPSLCYASENINPNFDHYFSQEVGNSNFQFCPSNIIPLPSRNEHDYESVDLFTMDEHNNNFSLLAQVFSDDSMEEILCLRQDMVVEKGNMDNSIGLVHTPLKRKIEMPELPNALEDEVKFKKSDKKTIKKNRVSRDNKNKKNGQPKKNQKVMDAIVNDNGTDPEDTNSNSNNNNKRDKNAQSSSYCSSEDDSNTCQDLNGGAIKTRASRGAATDPQSLYARKRRERINERLRILQNLVPNGTKVDISTMLEEAVHYVKFLQLQIKLLSSDEMWMYAPIAYNGMDMGLYQKISPTLQ